VYGCEFLAWRSFHMKTHRACWKLVVSAAAAAAAAAAAVVVVVVVVVRTEKSMRRSYPSAEPTADPRICAKKNSVKDKIKKQRAIRVREASRGGGRKRQEENKGE
jgi:dihydroxyacetone kinase-like predicted kinase